MGARVVRAAEAPSYHPPLHSDVDARRLQGHEAGPTDRFWVGESLYHPGGRAETAEAPAETVYVVLEGALELTLADGSTTLAAGDSVHLPAGTVRGIGNVSDVPARLLVVIATPTEEVPA